MTCSFAHDDASYVLGALSPADRLEFERHLATCAACTRAVRELAGLPGLLGRVDAAVLEHPPVDVPVPATLHSSLSREVGRGRRRRALKAAGAAAVAAALVAAVVAWQVTADDHGSPAAAPGTVTSSSPGPASTSQAMEPVGEVPVRARVSLEQVAWGTRLGLTCTYEPASVEYALPETVDYTLFVRTRTGQDEQVGSWRSIGGRTMNLSAGTAARRGDIASVEVRTPDGRVVLRLPL